MQGILTMSTRELERLKIVAQVETNKLTVIKAAELLEISERQTYRIIKKIKTEGSKGVIHKLRGKKSNRGYSGEFKKKIIGLYSKQYDDYGPTLFSEMLVKYHKISITHETLRTWLRENGITTSIRKKRPHRKKRERRSCFGELLQFDGSHHDWFEGRGAECCLLNCVDDATGTEYIKFGISENTQDAMLTMWEYINKYGIPRSIYTDYGSVYYAEGKFTDFGRAMKELNIETIFANSPQAKGRVERSNRTLQDRLVKALRRKGISNIAAANKYLRKTFIDEYNDQFAVNLELTDVHRSVEGYNLQGIFCYKIDRQVRNDFTINLAGGYIQLMKGDSPLPRPKQDVTVSKWLDDSLHIYFNNQQLKFIHVKGKPEKKGYKIIKPARDHPWRKANNRLPGHKDFSDAAFG